MFSIEIKSKHNHCRCSKLCPVFVDYEKFLTTWLSVLVIFVIAIMSIPLVKDPNFRRKTSCYFQKAKCYVLCMADKVKTSVGQLWKSREENRAKGKQAIAGKKDQIKAKAKDGRKKSEAKAKEDMKKMDKKNGKTEPSTSSKSRSRSPTKPDRSQSPTNGKERRPTNPQSKKSVSDLPGLPSKRKSSQKSD